MKVIVFGGTGMLGSMVVQYLVESGVDVTFTTRGRLPSWFPLKKPLGVLRYDAVDPLPDLAGYDAAINCIGSIKQKNEPTHVMYATNAVFPWKLAVACQKANVRLIHVSSDCVFSGKSPDPYLPGAPKDAEDDYGKSKALGEPAAATVLRTSIIGPAEETCGLFEWFFDGRHEVNGFTNHKWSGVTTLYLAQYIKSLLMARPSDILIQIASPEVTKCQLLTHMNEVFSHDVKITPVTAPETINRALLPTSGLAPNIRGQLSELRDWMKKHGR